MTRLVIGICVANVVAESATKNDSNPIPHCIPCTMCTNLESHVSHEVPVLAHPAGYDAPRAKDVLKKAKIDTINGIPAKGLSIIAGARYLILQDI